MLENRWRAICFRVRVIRQANVRGIIPGRARADVVRAVHVDQFDRVRLVVAAEAQREVVCLAIDLDGLGAVLHRQQHGDQIGADLFATAVFGTAVFGTAALGQADHRTWHVHFRVGIDAGRTTHRHQRIRLADAVRRLNLVLVRRRPDARVAVILQHLDVERQQFVRDLALTDAAFQSRAWHHDVRFGIRAGGFDKGQLGRPVIAGEVRCLPFLQRNLSLDRRQADQQFAEHHQPDAAMQQHDAGSLLKDHHAADQHHDAGKRRFQQLPQDAHRRIVQPSGISPHPQPRNDQAENNTKDVSRPELRLGRDIARSESRQLDGTIDRSAPQHRQPQFEKRPQRLPRDPAFALQTVRTGTARHDQPGGQHSQSDDSHTGPQLSSLRLRFESDAVGRHQIQKHQRADQPAAGKRNHHPSRQVRLMIEQEIREERGREKDLQVDPRHLTAEVFIDDLPDVLIDLSQRPRQHEHDRHRQQRDRQLQ